MEVIANPGYVICFNDDRTSLKAEYQPEHPDSWSILTNDVVAYGFLGPEIDGKAELFIRRDHTVLIVGIQHHGNLGGVYPRSLIGAEECNNNCTICKGQAVIKLKSYPSGSTSLGVAYFCTKCLTTASTNHNKGICQICRQSKADRTLTTTPYKGGQSKADSRFFRVHDKCAKDWLDGKYRWEVTTIDYEPLFAPKDNGKQP